MKRHSSCLLCQIAVPETPSRVMAYTTTTTRYCPNSPVACAMKSLSSGEIIEAGQIPGDGITRYMCRDLRTSGQKQGSLRHRWTPFAKWFNTISIMIAGMKTKPKGNNCLLFKWAVAAFWLCREQGVWDMFLTGRHEGVLTIWCVLYSIVLDYNNDQGQCFSIVGNENIKLS